MSAQPLSGTRLVLTACAALLATACTTAPAPSSSAPAATAAEAPAPATPPVKTMPANAEWTAWLSKFQIDYFAAQPMFAVSAGRHEYDGLLPDWSAEGIAKEVARLLKARAEAVAFDEATLTPHQRYEREYALWVIDADLFWKRDAEWPFRNPAFYTVALEPSVYLTRPYAPLEVRMKAYIRYLRSLPKAAAQIRANLRMPMPETYLALGIGNFGNFPEFLRKDAPGVFASVDDPALQKELKEATKPAAKAMEELAAWMKKQKASATHDFAIGPERFSQMLAMTERVSTPLAEVEAIGRADLERNLAELKGACTTYAPGEDLVGCAAKANRNKPEGGPVEGARAQLGGLRQFIVEKDLVSIPGDEQALVMEAPRYQRSNFAYIDVAGPYDKGMPSVYSIAPPDPAWPKSEQEAYLPGHADLLFATVHEVWPGHFLQFLHSNRSSFLFGQTFVGYAFAEGWAHYVEEMMWDAGLGDRSPEVHVGQLTNALLRNVRFVCAIGLHTQGMTVQECERLFREKGVQDPGNARQQAARGTYDPAYLNYTLGKLMILKLRGDWMAQQEGKGTLKRFHDELLSYGGPPIPLVRDQMLATRDGALF
ncbi:MAG TPA: DUF885 domain-containing protein [Nevskiaceae bacterium]|nr:DUF885 domain-containing protein [Nevskiaceae bacterium]